MGWGDHCDGALVVAGLEYFLVVGAKRALIATTAHAFALVKRCKCVEVVIGLITNVNADGLTKGRDKPSYVIRFNRVIRDYAAESVC